MNTKNAKLIRRYSHSLVPEHSEHSVYRWLKRYWTFLNSRERFKFKKAMKNGCKIPVMIKRRFATNTIMLEFGRPNREKQKSMKGRKIYARR